MRKLSVAGLRKICAGLCIIGMMAMPGAWNHSTYAQDTAKISASSGMNERGETVVVSLDLSGNPGIWGLKLRVSYNQDALTLDSVRNGEIFADEEVVMPESLTKDKYVFYASAAAMENISANGCVVTLNFKIAGEAVYGEYPITVEIVQAINVAGEEVSLAAGNGKVTVKEPEPPTTEEPSTEPESQEPSTEPTMEETTTVGKEITTAEPTTEAESTSVEETTTGSNGKVPGNVGTNDGMKAVMMCMLFVACATGFTFAKMYSKGR